MKKDIRGCLSMYDGGMEKTQVPANKFCVLCDVDCTMGRVSFSDFTKYKELHTHSLHYLFYQPRISSTKLQHKLFALIFAKSQSPL